MKNQTIKEVRLLNSDHLAHYNHNHDALGRFASSAGSAASSARTKVSSLINKDKSKSVSSGKAVTSSKKAKPAVKKGKSRKEKQAEVKEKRISEEKTARQRKAKASEIVNSGNAKLIYENRKDLTTKQLRDAIERMGYEKTIADYMSVQNPTKLDKIGKTMGKVKRIADMTGAGIDAYNQVARVINAFEGDQQGNDKSKYRNLLPYVENAQNKQKYSDGLSEAGKAIQKTTKISDLVKNSSGYNEKDMKAAAERAKSLNILNAEASKERKRLENEAEARKAKEQKALDRAAKEAEEVKVDTTVDNTPKRTTADDRKIFDDYFESEVEKEKKRRNK